MAEFKQKAVELSYVGGNTVEVCSELGLKSSVLGRWHRDASGISVVLGG